MSGSGHGCVSGRRLCGVISRTHRIPTERLDALHGQWTWPVTFDSVHCIQSSILALTLARSRLVSAAAPRHPSRLDPSTTPQRNPSPGALFPPPSALPPICFVPQGDPAADCNVSSVYRPLRICRERRRLGRREPSWLRCFYPNRARLLCLWTGTGGKRE